MSGGLRFSRELQSNPDTINEDVIKGADKEEYPGE